MPVGWMPEKMTFFCVCCWLEGDAREYRRRQLLHERRGEGVARCSARREDIDVGCFRTDAEPEAGLAGLLSHDGRGVRRLQLSSLWHCRPLPSNSPANHNTTATLLDSVLLDCTVYKHTIPQLHPLRLHATHTHLYVAFPEHSGNTTIMSWTGIAAQQCLFDIVAAHTVQGSRRASIAQPPRC